ncbi:MAG TPA: leucyl aminopeptidase family protein, partial [Sphingomonas sp.]|nr:leucyl aminopeptidase family protein [Sphingomonas sp.]
MTALLQPDRGQTARSIIVVHPDHWADWLATQPPRIRATVAAHRLTGKPGNRAVLPGEGVDDWLMLLVCNEALESPWRIASLGEQLPEGSYRLASGDVGSAGLGWMLAQHRFDRYRKDEGVAGPRVLLTNDPA